VRETGRPVEASPPEAKVESPASGAAINSQDSTRRVFGVNPLKLVFAAEYVLQGLANPFQGITYQPFFRHFRVDYGLSEAATQWWFSKSYLAWSFKPLIGFLIDAYGKTRIILCALLGLAVLFYLLTPFADRSVLIFFGFMFSLSVVLAATDVAVDRATVIAGDEEARASGRSKSTTVGLNQAICWTAIYGTSIVAAVSGGYIADHLRIGTLMYLLALVPLGVLGFVLLLPRDRAVPIPLKRSVMNFWTGLNTGAILWIMVFNFIFHFQPAMGPLWNNHLIENLGFSQTQIGLADGASYLGLFCGVLVFATLGIRWQDRLGLKRLFKIYILLSVAVNLTQYLLVDPWFGRVTGKLALLAGTAPEGYMRLATLCSYNFLQAVFLGVVRMSTFSLVGAVIPVNAAGSLFAGFMSVSNLAYSFSYGSGTWLYQHGLEFGLLRRLQEGLFGIPASAGAELSISMLILIGSLAFLLSFLASHMLPDRGRTLGTGGTEAQEVGPERYRALGEGRLKAVNGWTLALGVAVFAAMILLWGQDLISSLLVSFFGMTFLRKLVLDGMLARGLRGAC